MLIDISFLVLTGLALYKGLSRGFIVGIFSFIAYFIGLAAALKLSEYGARLLSGEDKEPALWMPVVSFLLIFLAVVIVVNLMARFIRSLVKAATLGWADKLGGFLLFFIIYSFILSILLFYFTEAGWLSEEVKNKSRIYPVAIKIGPAMTDLLGNIIPAFKNLFEDLKDFFDNLKEKI